MTLAFSTKWPDRMGELAGQPNYFIQKIWMGLPDRSKVKSVYDIFYENHVYKLNKPWDIPNARIEPKLHTIREDLSNRWCRSMDIHFVINNRTKNHFQFAPVVKCVSVQEIEIYHNVRLDELVYDRDGLSIFGCDIYGNRKRVLVDGNDLSWSKIRGLALNDGFPSAEAFFDYFNKDFKGKIIHWTDFKY